MTHSSPTLRSSDLFATSDQPVLRIRFAGERDVTRSYTLLDHEIKRPIERLSGVARVDISGVSPPEVEVVISNDRLSAHGLRLNDLATRLQAANFRSEEHTSELQSLMRITYALFC